MKETHSELFDLNHSKKIIDLKKIYSQILLRHCVCLNWSLSGHETFTDGLELVECLVMWFQSNLVSIDDVLHISGY